MDAATPGYQLLFSSLLFLLLFSPRIYLSCTHRPAMAKTWATGDMRQGHDIIRIENVPPNQNGYPFFPTTGGGGSGSLPGCALGI
jgi:hypothetical protein